MATILQPALLPKAPRAQARTRALGYPVILAVVLGYVMLLPPQFNLSVGGSVIPPFRFILIPAIAFIVATVVRGEIRFRWPDLLIILAAAWLSLSMFMTTETGEAFTAVIAQTTDMAVAYFFGRVTIRTLRDLRAFLLLMSPVLFAVGLIMMVESISHEPIIQPLASAITGNSFRYGSAPRLGLFRAAGPFPHPILAGMFLTSFLPLYLMSGLRGWPKILGLIASVCGFFSMSSAALLSLSSGLLLTTYNSLSERIVNLSWKLLFAGAAFFVFLAEASGAGTYRMIIKYGSLNSSSAFNRIRIWEYGSKNVESNPWFGIGYGDWTRPEWMSDSVDNFWLLTAMRFGTIVPVLFMIALVLATVMLARQSMLAAPSDRRTYRGVAIALTVYAFGATSVSLWGAAVVWFFVLMGLAVTLGSSSAPLKAKFPVNRRV